MLGFGNKKKEEEEKAKQEQVAQAMKAMSDQIAAQAQMIKQLQDQLTKAKADDAADDAANTAANRALGQAQAQLKQMQEQMAQMKADAEAKAKAEAEAEAEEAAAAKAAAPSGGAAAGAVGVTRVGPAAGAKAVEGAGAPPVTTVSGGLSVGVTAYVQKAGGKNLRLRDDPGLESTILDGLAPGTQLELLAGPVEKDGYPWWQIRASDGRKGWVAGTELVTQPE